MKHTKPTREFRSVRAGGRSRRKRARPEPIWIGLVFNLCLIVLPLAAAAAVFVIGRDHLYDYEYTPGAARSIIERVERLNADMIQIDFDRQRQWDNLVAGELMAEDPAAARGFLLSGAAMLPPRLADVLDEAADGGDAAIEVAALQLLLPGTRERYQASVQLISMRPAGAERAAAPPATLGDPRDFELMARALLTEPETDPLQFVLTGFSLGLAGEMSPSMNEGAVVLLAATRREDFPDTLANELRTLVAQALPIETFREAARISAEGNGDPGAFDNASVAFAASLDAQAVSRLHAALSEIGDVSEATSRQGSSVMVTHAQALTDLPRLRLLALTAGDRAAAAAKRLPRDGRLLQAARGQLAFNRELMLAVGVMALAFAGLVVALIAHLARAMRQSERLRREYDEIYTDEALLEINSNNWRPL